MHEKKDGIRIPRNKRWDITETKNVDDFLTQLFPNDFFAENDERMGLYEDDYLTRYDTLRLREAIDDIMKHYLSNNEQLILEFVYGIDRDKMTTKEIADQMNMTVLNVRKIKSRAIEKLDNQDVRDYLENYYQF